MADNVHITRLWLHRLDKNMPVAMHSSRQEFLLPMLIQWLKANKMLAEEAYQADTVQVYMNSYDPRLPFSQSPYKGAMWMGFTPDEMDYLRAQDGSAQAWFVPMTAALPSFTYFLGKLGVDYTPRVSTMLQPNDYMQYFFEAHKKGVKLHTDPGTLGIGVWLDYDGCANYRAMVINFFRIMRRVLEELRLETMFSFWAYETGVGPKMTADEQQMLRDLGVTIADSPIVLLNQCQYYISLDDNPTSFDPLAVTLASTKAVIRVLSPTRMDMLGLDFNLLPMALTNCIRALMSRGSPGVEALLETAGKAIKQMFNIDTKEK